jgi:PadR family transcriptional regulator, regulatory protein PadR
MDLNNWQAQLRKGLLDIAILNLLRDDSRHGYELVQIFRKSPGLRIHEGNIYPILARLKADGLVASYAEPSRDGPPRKYFKLTESGRLTLEKMNAHWDEVTNAIHNFRKADQP